MLTLIIELLGLGGFVYFFWKYILIVILGLYLLSVVLDQLSRLMRRG